MDFITKDLRISFVAPSGKTESITFTNEDALRLAEIITEAAERETLETINLENL